MLYKVIAFAGHMKKKKINEELLYHFITLKGRRMIYTAKDI